MAWTSSYSVRIEGILQTVRNVLRRSKKMLKGIVKTYLFGARPYDSKQFWSHAPKIRNDSETISYKTSPINASFHYANLEATICRALSLANKNSAVHFLDIGSGSGHWIEFFGRLFPSLTTIDACEISTDRCDFIRNKYGKDGRVKIHNCSVDKFKPSDFYDLVCMIGCAFHIVEDEELLEILAVLSGSLTSDGLILVNDLLPLVSYGNQFTGAKKEFYYKYVRSKKRWRDLAKKTDLDSFYLKNYSWIHSPGIILEDHLVCLRRKSM